MPVLPFRFTTVTSASLHRYKRASTVPAMNFIEEQGTDHAQNVMRKKERIETLEALLATYEGIGAEPDCRDVTELKERIRAARMQLKVMCGEDAPISTRATVAPQAIVF
jgi:hypothetical protein